MIKLHFKDTKQFEVLFKKHTKHTTDAIVKGIEEAMMSNRRRADIFQVSFDDVEVIYEISLPQSQWVTSLEQCLEFYHSKEESDTAIDTWKLLEAVKVW